MKFEEAKKLGKFINRAKYHDGWYWHDEGGNCWRHKTDISSRQPWTQEDLEALDWITEECVDPDSDVYPKEYWAKIWTFLNGQYVQAFKCTRWEEDSTGMVWDSYKLYGLDGKTVLVEHFYDTFGHKYVVIPFSDMAMEKLDEMHEKLKSDNYKEIEALKKKIEHLEKENIQAWVSYKEKRREKNK